MVFPGLTDSLFRIADEWAAYYLDPQTAQHILDILQPIQIGYGAVLLSFLGAIHWGLEFAGVGGHLVVPLLHLEILVC